MNALVINCSPVRTGATAFIAEKVRGELSARFNARLVCIDDYRLRFCTGCRSCHDTAECVIKDDDMRQFMDELDSADIIVFVSPSYWADVPGQFKAFIDRCTPWSNTHEPHARLKSGKKGWCIALRTGPGMKECERLTASIEHFCGHMEIEPCGALGLCGVSCREDAEKRCPEIEDFCRRINN